jgi:tungstate transport system permease protein
MAWPGFAATIQAVNSMSNSFSTAWQLITSGDAQLWMIIGRSLAVSGTATLLGFVMGCALGAWLAMARFAGRQVVLAVLNSLLALPSVVVGLMVYLLLSRSGPLGQLGWLFSFKAMVLAQTLLVIPIVAAWVRQSLEDAERSHGEQLRAMGARRGMRAVLLMLDERFVLLSIAIAAFGRAIAEVGAVMIVGGNIDGFTRVMTTAIALETSKGDLPLALGLGMVLMMIVLGLNAVIALIKGWREQREVMAA